MGSTWTKWKLAHRVVRTSEHLRILAAWLIPSRQQIRRFLWEKTGPHVKVYIAPDICHSVFQLLLHYCCLKIAPILYYLS